MTMLIFPDLEPVARLRSAIPESCHALLAQLLGMVPQPPDQPACATSIATLAKCLVDYAETIANTRPFFVEWAGAAQCIHDSASNHILDIQGLTPSASLTGRFSDFPALALLLTLKEEHHPLRVPFGAEIARCLLEQTQLKQDYCVALRRDTAKYGRPQPGDVRMPEDLAELGFGRGWLVRFQKIDVQVRRRVELDELGPRRPQHAHPHHVLDLLARLRWRLDYPNPKHRQAAIDDSHLPLAHYRRVATMLRTRVEARDGAAVIQSLCLLVNLPPRLLLSLPLVTGYRPLNMLGISVQTGCLQLNLRALFPNRARPPDATANLFHFSGDTVVVPLPAFLVQEIQRRSQTCPQALLLGDLVDWVQADSRDSLIPVESCKLHASLARASKSTGAISLALGNDRLVSACVGADFSLIGSARMYYARLTGREIHTGCTRLYAGIGWGVPVMDAEHLPSLGSRATLRPDGAKHLFSALAEAVTASRPGRNAHAPRLLAHHTHFTRYCVALICFCAGLRDVQCYRLLAEELLWGQDQIVVHDKQGGDALMAQPTLLNALTREQIRLYAAHARALVQRLQRINDRQVLVLAQELRNALAGTGPLFLTLSSSGTVLAAGAHFTWREVPESIKVPPNIGRHFWQNVLRERGLSSRDIDSFMRHRVVGLERNTNSQVSVPRQTLDRIETTQLAVMREIGIQALTGLRRE
ncbi:hypothetical protein J8G26_10420 [Acidovorax sp. JG5]|uniref:hypothetical protein n=1 Tax=Acidovorax sp. JG5 TaxID=2822718 RepID=UPI001B344C16|nr:hypothetical protein [Acidovorax sp. JG5]MBP3981140.1 hypothetical protein [Acidovorax sp. JG5]